MQRATRQATRRLDPERGDPCELLDWDSRHFGFPIARVAGNGLSPEGAAAVDDWCVERGVRCLYLLADGTDSETAKLARANGYIQPDIRVTVRGRVEDLAKFDPGGPDGLEIRDATEAEVGPLSDLGARSHRGSRFYADPGFPRERSDALYRAWVERGFHHPDHALLAALVDGEPAGYMVHSQRVIDGVSGGELGATDERFRRQGISQALHVTMFRRLASRGAITHQAALSGRNPPILLLHERLGFEVTNTEAWFHKWFEPTSAPGEI
jgi:GNAT superfamily N-acetyltransferase